MKVGSKVICIEDHTEGRIKKGEEFTVTGVYDGYCRKNTFKITVGIKSNAIFNRCIHCGTMVKSKSEWMFNSARFREIDEHNFTNKLTAELAQEAMKEFIEYDPIEAIPVKRRRIEIQ